MARQSRRHGRFSLRVEVRWKDMAAISASISVIVCTLLIAIPIRL